MPAQRNQFLSIIMASGLTCIAAAGCGKITMIDYYNPTPTTFKVQTLGNSYLDYQNGYKAYIPTYLNQFASAYYGESVV